MKKIFWIAAAAAGLLVTAACQKEPAAGVGGGDAKVTLTVEIPEVIQTKAMSQAEHADIVYYEIWNSDWTEQLYPADGVLASAVVDQRKATVDVTVIVDQTYNFVFWAQDKDHTAYDVTDLLNVKVDYSVIAADGNQDKYDAYYAVETIEVKGSIDQTVTLYRPFAQLNFGASKMNSLFGDITVDGSEITVTDLATVFDTRAGKGKDKSAEAVTFKASDIATDELLSTNNTTYTWIAMDYMLMMDEKSNVDVTASFNLGMKAPVQHNITNVPLHRNYRTNIIGDLFTADAHLDVVIDQNFNKPDYDVFAALHEGGLITLHGDVVLYPEHPMIAVAGPEKPVVIDLNGFSIKTKDGKTVYRPDEVSALISVQNGSVVTIKGSGLVDGGPEDYAVEVRNGVLNIEGGDYVGAYTAAYAVEGTINISGGTFSDSLGDNRYVLNLKDENGKNGTAKINVTGGTFVGFNPEDNAAENPQVNFVADGYQVFDNFDGTYTVAVEMPDYVVNGNVYEVYTANGLAKWAYAVNNIDNTTGLKLMRSITLPAKEIVADAANETYTFTGADITVTGDVPSGSNWIPVGMLQNGNPFYKGIIDGNGKTITGLRINSTTTYTALVAIADGGSGDDDAANTNMEAVALKSVNLNDAVIYSTAGNTGGIVGYARNISTLSDCHIYNSTITGGGSETGGIAGRIYTRKWDVNSVMSDCTTDANSRVIGDSSVGGIVGMNYGAIVLHCDNAASVSARYQAGGIVGYSREYQNNRNGYVIACGNTGNVAAADSRAGGIVGYNLQDTGNFDSSESAVIACWSTAESITALSERGLLVGKSYYSKTIHYASWAIKTTSVTSLVPATETTACYAYGSASEITQADVDAMNAAIAAYNSTRAGKQSYCPYTWSWTAGSLPELTK